MDPGTGRFYDSFRQFDEAWILFRRVGGIPCTYGISLLNALALSVSIDVDHHLTVIKVLGSLPICDSFTHKKTSRSHLVAIPLPIIARTP